MLRLAAILALALAVTPAKAGADAEDVAQDIYDFVEKACPMGGDGLPYNLATIADNYFVPDLRDMLAQAYAHHAVQFDILIDSQDCEIRDVDVDVESDDDEADRVVARAEFANFGEPRVVDLLMVRHGHGWKVADIAYRHRNWQLRRDLAVGYTK
jgi:hypothetical protein